ncbi:hypothetical protein J6590_078339 [Homalodisca vitripennis]|nr:hypothetical protein J6590_078339 [Homalodisca vitripennis]
MWKRILMTPAMVMGCIKMRPLYPLYMRWGVTKLQVADLAGAQTSCCVQTGRLTQGERLRSVDGGQE